MKTTSRTDKKKCNGCVHLSKRCGYFYCIKHNNYTGNITNCNQRKEKDK